MRQFSLLYVHFPTEIQGEVFGMTHWEPEKNRFMIVIDESQSDQIQDYTLKHELSHILLKHDERLEISIDQAEDEADQYADQMTEDELNYLLTFAVKIKHLSGHFDSEYRYIQA